MKQFDFIYSLFSTDSRVTELQALAAAYVEALEGQVNDGKSGVWIFINVVLLYGAVLEKLIIAWQLFQQILKFF